MEQVKLSQIIAPSFFAVHSSVKNNEFTHYWLKGGRGSTKSSFVSIELIHGIMSDPMSNAVVLRKVKDTLQGSVFSQLMWAIDALKVNAYWNIKHSPLELTYIPTGQKILFRGADDPKKIKSIKVAKGYVKYVWFEEVDEFGGVEEIRTINQSLLRGGENFVVFYSYNPPRSVQSWVNQEVAISRDDRMIHSSTYLTVPKEWLGRQFIIEAEHLKKANENAYNHEYMGEVTGTGGEIFSNVTLRAITDEEIAIFDQIRRGIDYGYAVDPFTYIVCHHDQTRKKLYIFFEIYKVGLSNRKAVDLIKLENKSNKEITADSAEPKSIAEMKDLGLRIKGAKKGPDSVEYGIKFLQDLEKIIIDDRRCPNVAREFINYELEKDGQGNFKAKYPDKNNHGIDGCRYALEDDMKKLPDPIIDTGQSSYENIFNADYSEYGF
jgi:PBSX family phage terminase large subunit